MPSSEVADTSLRIAGKSKPKKKFWYLITKFYSIQPLCDVRLIQFLLRPIFAIQEGAVLSFAVSFKIKDLRELYIFVIADFEILISLQVKFHS